MIKIHNQAGECVSKSQNLRGILDRARKIKPINVVAVQLADGGGLLKIRFADYSYTSAHFASFRALREWLESRKIWQDYDFTIVA